MMHIEQTRAESFLRECWLIHQHFTENVRLLQDEATRKAYDGLMAVRNEEGLKDWLRLMEHLDIHPSAEAVRYEDVLGRAKRLLQKMEPEELPLVADGIAKMASVGFKNSLNEDFAILDKQRELAVGDNADDLVVFQKGNGWFAYGKDADQLFERMSWQTTEAATTDGAVSWMNISEQGIFALHAAIPEVHVLQPNVNIILVEDLSERAIKADELSLAQQSIDALRMLERPSEAVVSLGLFPVMVEGDGMLNVESAQYVRFYGQNVDVVMNNGQSINIVTGQSWRIGEHGADYVLAVGDMLDQHQEEVGYLLEHYGTELMKRQLKTDEILDEFCHLKEQYPSNVLLVQQKGFYEAFGDDAVKIAEKCNLHLWERETTNGRITSAVVLTPHQLDIVELAFEDRLSIVGSGVGEQREDFVMKSSPLNDALHLQLPFEECGIAKHRNGEFVLWAQQDGMNLPEMRITPYEGVQYTRLSDGAEKQTVLKMIVQRYCEDTLFKHEEQSLSASVKI